VEAAVMSWPDRIVINERVMVGKPVIKGTRVTVELVLELLAGGWSTQKIMREYPGLVKEDILACIDYAREQVSEMHVFPLSR
jgi:uncharacterized protein (DUF433 family)